MTDNVILNPGTGGDTVAADDIAGIKYQRIKTGFGEEGVYADVSTTTPMPVTIPTGELIEAIEALRMTVGSLSRTIGMSIPDLLGRQRVVIDTITGGSTLSNVTLLSTLTNQTQIGGFVATDQIPALMHMSADNLRANIKVT